jgi:hypothetical protein
MQKTTRKLNSFNKIGPIPCLAVYRRFRTVFLRLLVRFNPFSRFFTAKIFYAIVCQAFAAALRIAWGLAKIYWPPRFDRVFRGFLPEFKGSNAGPTASII